MLISPFTTGVSMFCPSCGTLAFPDSKGHIKCPNYKCGYDGDASNVVKTADGGEIDLSKTMSSSKVQSRKYEVINDADNMRGVLTNGDYICPKCDKREVFSYLEQTRASDEPETRMLTCKSCKHGWREY
ncbi:MAG: hypothetical protein HOB52_01590 [Euryarchaeota archaeon]|nr:hypothetical protein [Euryarchaeota archaeon]MBT4406869.1 hypothetical protein [Euryarchaeota archaeon]MBT6644482.1 hypothetical protein [Euryarchaeota archaeon]